MTQAARASTGRRKGSAPAARDADVAATQGEALPVEELEEGLRVAASARHAVAETGQADLAVGRQQLLEAPASVGDRFRGEPEVLVDAHGVAAPRQGVEDLGEVAGRTAQLFRQAGEGRRRHRFLAQVHEDLLCQGGLRVAEDARAGGGVAAFAGHELAFGQQALQQEVDVGDRQLRRQSGEFPGGGEGALWARRGALAGSRQERGAQGGERTGVEPAPPAAGRARRGGGTVGRAQRLELTGGFGRGEGRPRLRSRETEGGQFAGRQAGGAGIRGELEGAARRVADRRALEEGGVTLPLPPAMGHRR